VLLDLLGLHAGAPQGALEDHLVRVHRAELGRRCDARGTGEAGVRAGKKVDRRQHVAIGLTRGRTHYQHRAAAAAQQVLGGGAHERVAQRIEPARPDHEQRSPRRARRDLLEHVADRNARRGRRAQRRGRLRE
jgi:hypothetical protein